LVSRTPPSLRETSKDRAALGDERAGLFGG
jgi:hypothetical protein